MKFSQRNFQMALTKVQCDFFDTIGNCSLKGLTSPYYINVHIVTGNFTINSLTIQMKVMMIEAADRKDLLLIDTKINYCMFLSKQLHNQILNVINRSLEGAAPTECPIDEVISELIYYIIIILIKRLFCNLGVYFGCEEI